MAKKISVSFAYAATLFWFPCFFQTDKTPSSIKVYREVMFSVAHTLGTYLYPKTYAQGVKFVGTMSYWIKLRCLATEDVKNLAFVVLPLNHSLRWRLIRKILQTFDNCNCSNKVELLLSKHPLAIPGETSISVDDVEKNLEERDLVKFSEDVDVNQLNFIPGPDDACLLCSQWEVIPWNHFQADLQLLEIIHKKIKWVYMGIKKFYSGWVTVNSSATRHVSVLFEVNLERGVVSFVMGQFVTTEKGEEQYRIVTTPLALNPSFLYLFKVSGHRPVFKLENLALPIVLKHTALHMQMPETLKPSH